MEINKFGGNCSLPDIERIMRSGAAKGGLNYSQTKENRWNMWAQDVGMTLSFVLNRGLFIPSISGLERKTLEKFYSTCPSDVSGWVLADVKIYLEESKRVLQAIEDRREQEAYEEYMRRYYADMKAIDDYYDSLPKETDCQRYNRLHNTFLTEEEYAFMYGLEEVKEDVKQLVKRKPKPKRKDKQVPGQLSLFDFMEE